MIDMMTCSLNEDWLHDQVPTITTTNTHGTTTACYVTDNYWWPYQYPQPWYVQPYYHQGQIFVDETEKITLKLSEVERLRKVAKQNKALKEILGKFTHLIEIEVDFD